MLKLITNVHTYNTRQSKTEEFALTKSRSNSGAKIWRYSSIIIKSEIPLKISEQGRLNYYTSEN